MFDQLGCQEESLTQERSNDRHQAGPCPELQDGLVHQVERLAVGVQVVAERQSLGGVRGVRATAETEEMAPKYQVDTRSGLRV